MKLKIDPSLKFAAYDEPKGWWAYEVRPAPKTNEWRQPSAEYRNESLGAFINLPPSTYWRNSLHKIIDGCLIPYRQIPTDGQRVEVWRGDSQIRENRYSAGKLNQIDHLYCYTDGGTKWSSNGSISAWEHWREVE